MARSLPLLVLGTAFVLVAATLPAASDAVWTPVKNPNELVIQQVGRFAVIVYSLGHHTDLSFVDVVRAETEDAVGGGTLYHLVVAVEKPDRSGAQYQCMVWGVPGSSLSTWKLRRFRKM